MWSDWNIAWRSEKSSRSVVKTPKCIVPTLRTEPKTRTLELPFCTTPAHETFLTTEREDHGTRITPSMADQNSNLNSPTSLTSPTPPTRRPISSIEFAALFVLAIALFWQCQAIRVVASTTFDETIYATFCSQTIKSGTMNQYAEYGTAPLPVLWNYSLPVAYAPPIAPPTSLWTEVAVPPWIVQWARTIQACTVGLLLVVVPHLWTRTFAGGYAGLIVAAMVAFSPSIVAHAALATTDAPFVATLLLALSAMTRYLRSSQGEPMACASIPWIGVAVGISLSTKYSAVVLLPISALVVFAKERVGAKGSIRDQISNLFLLFAIAFFVWWATHGFAWISFSVGSRSLMLPAPLGGFLKQMRLATESRPVFLCGQISERGWWYYFPLAWWYKSTPVEIGLGAIAIVGSAARIWNRRRSLVAWPHDFPEQWLPLCTGVLYLAMAMQSTMNTGHRYLLPIYPLLALVGVDVLADFVSKRFSVPVACILVGLQIQAAASICPHDLAYFNPMCGGPERGHELLVDSSLDWGQDLPSLAALLSERADAGLILAYFGTARPADYGVHCIDWLHATKSDVGRVRSIAISATFLHGIYLDDDFFAEFRKLPAERAGYSIFVYSVDNPEVRQAAERMLVAVDKAKIAKAAASNPPPAP